MAEQFKDRKQYLWTFFFFLKKFLESGGKEGKTDLEVAVKGLGMDWNFIEQLKDGDEKVWVWVILEALKSGEAINDLKSLECCPFRGYFIIFKKGFGQSATVKGEIAQYLESLISGEVVEARLNPDGDERLFMMPINKKFSERHSPIAK